MPKKNPYKIEPIKNTGKNIQPIGHEIFPQLSASIYISASTKSGKTTLIYHIIKNCIDKDTKIFIFSPTVGIDKAYKEIARYLKKKKIVHELHPHFIDEEGNDLLDGIISKMIEENKKSKDDTEEAKDEPIAPVYHKMVGGKIVSTRDLSENNEKKEESESDEDDNITSPKYMFILDDLGDEMRKPSLYKLLLKQRHFHVKTILSSQ